MAGIAYVTFYYYTGYIPFLGDLKNNNGKLIDFKKLSKDDYLKSSIVRANGNEIIGRFYYEDRDPAMIDDIPYTLFYAFIATEDKRFNKERPKKLIIDKVCDPLYGGIDPCAIIRAGIGHLMRARNLSGASTLAQQVSRQVYAEDVDEFKNRDKNIYRKIKEARIAIQLVKRYSGDEIILNLMNRSWFGHGVNGVREACRYYFNKECAQLNLREAVILASMNKSAFIYCPIFHQPTEPEDKKNEEIMSKYKVAEDAEVARVAKARDRYNSVLIRMFEDGYISKEEYDGALFKPDEPRNLASINIQPLKNPHFSYGTRFVKEFMFSQGFKDQDLTHNGGFQIYTTFDPKIQQIATEEFEKHLEIINEGKNSEDQVNGAFAVIDIKTGNILALSGGSNFNESQFNRAFAFRSPGSGFKPFVYATAIDKFGYDLFTKVCNCPFSMRGNAPGQRWTPRNFEEKNPLPLGYLPLWKGVTFSQNLETLNLAIAIGIQPIVDQANDMGIAGISGVILDSNREVWFKRPGYEVKGGLVPLLPTAIGASDVNLLELANAYSVFFRDGVYIRPKLIREVKDTIGRTIWKSDESYQERVLSEETSAKIMAMMRAVTKIGTAKISMRDIEQQVACKTGTSDGPRDVSIWCGTPEIFIGIRFGRDDYKVIELPEYMKKVSGDADMLVSGGWVAGPLMRKIIDRIYSDRPKLEFSEKIEEYNQLLLDSN